MDSVKYITLSVKFLLVVLASNPSSTL